MPELTIHDRFLAFKVHKGFKDRGLPYTQEYQDRIAFELGVIAETKFATYFHIVGDLCDFMRRNNILFNVRGSGCGSVVVWGLGISHRWLDPIELQLPFERFLNPARVSNPDLDIDIQDDRRHEVVTYTIQKYGADRVARIITFGTMGAKVALNDVGRAMPELFSDNYQAILKPITGSISAIQSIEEALQASDFLREERQKYPDLFAYAQRMEGKARHDSVHAAGVIIAPDEIIKFCPLYWKNDPEKRKPEDWDPTTQWDMYDCEGRGLLKMDYLGLKTLKVMAKTIQLINQIKTNLGHEDPLDYFLENIDRRCPKTWAMIARGDLAGVFQVERQFVRNFAKRMNLKPGDHWQLAVLISIIRPGMMDTGATEVYIKRAGGLEAVVPLHPLVETTLKTNYGCLVFQEDVMWVCRDFAGFTLAEADEVRRCMGKKLPEKLVKIKPKFIEGALKKGATQLEAEEVWEKCFAFAHYGFNRSHAAAYGVVTAYMTAWLKANWPLPYMTCLINSESGVGNVDDGYNYKVAEYIEEARNMGITIESPCVKRSRLMCKLNWADNSIQFGLVMIKQVTTKAAEWIVGNCREANSLKDFILKGYEHRLVPVMKKSVKDSVVTKTPIEEWRSFSMVGKGSLEAMTLAGALDVFGLDRSKVLAMIPTLQDLSEKWHDQACKIKNGKKVKAGYTPEDIEALINAYELSDEAVPNPMDLETQLEKEREVTGCFLSQSPFVPFRHIERDKCNTTIGAIINPEEGYDWMQADEHGNPILATFLGMLTRCLVTTVKQGPFKSKEMAFMGFTGVGGNLECVCFSREWETITVASGPPEKGKVYKIMAREGRTPTSPIICGIQRLSNQGVSVN